MIVRSIESPAVGMALREYLRDRLGVQNLHYHSPPLTIPDGCEAYTFQFQLAGRKGLPNAYRKPLVLRLYANACGVTALRREYAVQSHLFRRGYPVARPLLMEEDTDHLGGPFMLMECVPGHNLLEFMFRRPWQIFVGPFQMGALHARLHNLPVEDFPASARPFLDRRLKELEQRLDTFDLPGLRPGLEWLRDHRPPDPTVPSILHLDYHPVNLLRNRGRLGAVLDWPEADVGDAHADVATTLVLMKTTYMETTGPLRRALAWMGRLWVRRFYLRAYEWRRPLDRQRLTYYMALAALRRLSRWGMWLRESPSITGCKPSAMQLLAGDRVSVLERCFADQAGVPVRLIEP